MPSASASSPIDLADLDPAVWRFLIEGQVYGPYTFGQVQTYAAENRIAAETPASDAGTADFRPAADHPGLQSLFDAAPAPVARIVVSSGLDAAGRDTLLRTLNRFGGVAEACPGVVALRTGARLSEVRDAVAANLGAGDWALLVDTSRDRIAWAGLPPDAGDALRALWREPLEGSS